MNQAVVCGVLCFDRFSLDLTRGCLRVGEQDIDLRPKAFEVLRYLAENAGRLVAKQELYDAVWPNVIVSEGSIAQCIRELRNKLGDGDHSLIRTVSRRGYLLDATVLAGAPQHLRYGSAAMPQPARPHPPQRGSAIAAHRLGVWAAVATVLLVTAAWWMTSVPNRDPTKLSVQPKLEKAQTGGPYDGFWRVDFSNNEFCIERSRIGLWSIRQGVVKGGPTLGGKVTSTGELRFTWPTWFDPTLTNVGSARLEGDQGQGKWNGHRGCGGVLTLTRLPGPPSPD